MTGPGRARRPCPTREDQGPPGRPHVTDRGHAPQARRRRGRVGWACAALLVLVQLSLPAPLHAQAEKPCRLALVLALDVSGSVDAREYRQQLDGTARALLDPEVQAAFFALPGAYVELAAFQWAARDQQHLLLDWTPVTSSAVLRDMAARLAEAAAPFDDPQTAIGAAMLFGEAKLRERAGCWAQTMDISGDGPSNHGPFPDEVLRDLPPNVTVNALVIGPGSRDNITKNLANAGTLLDYYEARVLRGAGAFAVTARTFDDYADALKAKLLRELRPLAVASAPPGGRAPTGRLEPQ
ncbi:DUF1194 domain-containing protein [Roseovarius sp. SCSIO 43702]|uniref:DUF1194 domain-containing protein n=1 Tax=Roseovarius sp. SCSIO 43702 TaxID=2823043 RepID=UPI001C73BE0E|nr:DUF1194 domain-containing protein [Roseovarius sp. SCSIO 43702]QYX55838.1 DUF1194 domain-containing protein [Roseovarius sp. SCSIO 43702]